MKRVIAVLLFGILLCCVFSACGTTGIILTEKTEHTYLLKYKFKETSAIIELKAHHYDKETGEEVFLPTYWDNISFSNNFSPNWLVPKGNEITFLVGQIGEALSNCDTTNYRVKIVLEYMPLKDFENLADVTDVPTTYTVEYWLN